MSDQLSSALLGTVLGLLSAVVTSFIIPYMQKRMEKAEQKRGIYEKYAQPLAADAVNLIWRLDEILFNQRGQYLRENAPLTPFNEYKRISTCYRIAAILGWIRAIRLEQSYLFYGDQPAVDALRRAVVDFESALADSPWVEIEVVKNLARLWKIELPEQAEPVARGAAQVAADLQHFLSKYGLVRYHELAALDREKALETVRHIAGSIARMLGHPPVPEQVLADTCAAALKMIGVRQAWIYRDWQQAIGNVMIKEISENSGAVRRFDIIGYGDFEGLLRDADKRWIDRLQEVVIGIDVGRADPADLRLLQLRQVARAVASLVCSIETMDLERRIIDPQSRQLARKFLATLPAPSAQESLTSLPGLAPAIHGPPGLARG
jgi:hypothetical protein